jgi:hypothetical protein
LVLCHPVSRLVPLAPRLPPGPLLLVSLGRYPFAEPTTHWEALPHGAGLFVILERPTEPGQSYRPLFLHEAEDVRQAIAKLNARARLPRVGTGSVVYTALYTALVPAARRQIVAELRTAYHLPATLPPARPSALASPPRSRRGRERRGAHKRGA